MSNANIQGDLIYKELSLRIGQHPSVKSIRHMGLMIGVELSVPCVDLINIALDNKLLINVTADKVVRLLPPLVIKKEEVMLLVKRLSDLILNFLEKNDK